MVNRRLLGIVRFFDPSKGFGFIDTNGFGIEEPDSVKKTLSIQLYFRDSDIIDGSEYISGEWVSFVYTKTKNQKRDRARFIRVVKFSEEDYSLALNYCKDFSIIESSMIVYDDWSINWHRSGREESVFFNVMKVFTQGILKDGQNKQFVFDALIDAFSANRSDVPGFLIDMSNQPETCLNLFLDPFSEGIVVRDKESLDRLLCSYSVRLIHRLYNPKSQELCLLSTLIRCLSESSLKTLRAEISSRFNYEDRERFVPYESSIQYILNQLPIDSFKIIFNSYDFNPTPKLRSYIYTRKRDVSVLLDESMIDYWNGLINEYHYPFTFHRNSEPFPREIGVFLSESNKSSDCLLLWGFLESTSLECLNRIKSRPESFIPLLKRDNQCFRKFILLAKIIPGAVLENTMKCIGLDYIALVVPQLVYGKELDEFVQCSPRSITIKTIAVSKTIHETQKSETVCEGGHFTWGEGWNDRYVTTVYLVQTCSGSVYVENSYYSLVQNVLSELRDRICKILPSCGSHKLFSFTIQETKYLFSIRLQDTPDSNYMFLFSDIPFSTMKPLSRDIT